MIMAKAIMIQGTMSNAGKSLLAAGLCRIFKQDGYKVAPFKSQNMALNSFITQEGLEMGRAQVMQAEAAGISPSVLMNPILLKPTNDVGSQVIVNGEVLGTMSARDYFKYKKQLVPKVMEAYETLAEKYDIIVIEGAGSPAEINLKEEDIVNMGMAKMAKAPVLLVGDIDRGGVFAQLMGTIMLLEPDEQKMVKGMIINKFRGDKTILDPGVEMLEERTHIPVVGVAPYMELEVEDEDSLTERFSGKQEVDLIDIAVIRVPRISNFTDFNALEVIPGVSPQVCTSCPGTEESGYDHPAGNQKYYGGSAVDAAKWSGGCRAEKSRRRKDHLRRMRRLSDAGRDSGRSGTCGSRRRDQRHGSSAYGYGIQRRKDQDPGRRIFWPGAGSSAYADRGKPGRL